MIRLITTVYLLFVLTQLFAQDVFVTGVVSDSDGPLVGANVVWADTSIGVTTNEKGVFSIPYFDKKGNLKVSFIGYEDQTIKVKKPNEVIRVELKPDALISEIDVVQRKKGIEVSSIEPLKIETIGQKELTKAACCNLSESFESNPSVDVSFTDAVSGTKQIQMLGLAGPYVALTTENLPFIFGVNSTGGLGNVPGPWIENIHLSKGVGSVVNGHESIAGHIDATMWRPHKMDKLYLNGYLAADSRAEANVMARIDVKDNIQSGIFGHYSYTGVEFDRNDDGFRDEPLRNHWRVANRWNISLPKMHISFGIMAGEHVVKGGSTTESKIEENSSPTFETRSETSDLHIWSKTGFLFKKEWQSLAWLNNLSTTNRTFDISDRALQAQQLDFRSQLMYKSIIKNTNHQFTTGIESRTYDLTQSVDTTIGTGNLAVIEKPVQQSFINQIFSGFYEYTNQSLEQLTIVAGIRADYNRRYGTFLAPRLHVKYAPVKKSIFRLTAGRGYRDPFIIADNIGRFYNNRSLINFDFNAFEAERAWNYGISFTRHFELGYREGLFSVDLFRTDFDNQIVANLELSGRLSFEQENATSYANSVQLQFDYELVKRLDFRIAYRYFDVKQTIDGQIRQKPLLSKHRGLVNLTYESRNHWEVNLTTNVFGPQRIPPVGEQSKATTSSIFPIFTTQISKTWKERFEWYIGSENIFNYTQNNPIHLTENPSDPAFDASLVWGPVFGRNIYTGFRYHLLK